MTRYYVLQGDTTSAGGKVLAGENNFIWHGKPQAVEGHPVWCPACKSTGVIKCVGTRISSKIFGKEMALDGDLCVCKCNPPPRLIAAQSIFSNDGVVDDAPHTFTHDLFFRVANDLTGQSMAHVRYRIVLEDGREYVGITDEHGHTEQVYSHSAQIAKIEVPYYGDSPAHAAVEPEPCCC